MVARTHSTSTRGSGSVTVGDPLSGQPTPTDTAFSEETSSDDEYEVEEHPDDPVEGWPRVALLMAKTPDFAAFSRFRDLNVKSLLYYQAQLTRLRLKLHKQEYKDLRRNKNNFARRADYLMSDKGSEQFKLVIEIRTVLKEYSELPTHELLLGINNLINRTDEALLQYSQISALPEPESYNMKSFRKWLRHDDGGRFSIRGGGEQNTWGELYENPDAGKPSLWTQLWILLRNLVSMQPPSSEDLDLVMTRPSGRIDGFTRWVACFLIPFYEELRLYREKIKADKRNDRVTSDAEKATKNAYHMPFYAQLCRYREKGKEDTSKQQTLSDSTPAPIPQNWIKKVKKEETIATWSEKGMLKFTSGISTVIACLLPVVAITVLSQIHETRNLLLCLAGFAVAFAIGLMFLTNGTSSRVEIFTATSASVSLPP